MLFARKASKSGAPKFRLWRTSRTGFALTTYSPPLAIELLKLRVLCLGLLQPGISVFGVVPKAEEILIGYAGVQSFVRTFVVEDVHELVEARLLLKKIGGGRLGGSFFKVRCMRS
jgi:hypothetical protein